MCDFINYIVNPTIPTLAIARHAVEFLCRSAANRCNPRSISAAGGRRQNRLNILITMGFPAPRGRFSRVKTHFSAVDSGIAALPISHEGDYLAAVDALASIII